MAHPKKQLSAATDAKRLLQQQILDRQPAHQFEKQTGLTGIATRYVMPRNMQPFDLEDMVVKLSANPDALPLYNDLWKQLEALNPALGQIAVQRDDVNSMDYALMGVTSGFNIDDINFFLEGHRTGVPAYTYKQNPPHIKKLYNEIAQRAGTIPWVPAPATLEKIKTQLDAQDERARKNKPGTP